MPRCSARRRSGVRAERGRNSCNSCNSIVEEEEEKEKEEEWGADARRQCSRAEEEVGAAEEVEVEVEEEMRESWSCRCVRPSSTGV